MHIWDLLKQFFFSTAMLTIWILILTVAQEAFS